MKRPGGISVLALLLLLNGASNAVYVAILYSHPEIGADFVNACLKYLVGLGPVDAAGILLAAMAGAVVSLVIGAGLWLLQEPARWGLLVATGIPLGRGLISAAASLAQNPDQFGRYFGAGFWIRTIVCGAIVLYLVQPEVQAAFGARKEYYDAYAPTEHESRSRG
jgi:4-hydroxybenzoate polyprenyltransferase